eukprot:7831303-Alexandrium_andersonii.AAC.1
MGPENSFRQGPLGSRNASQEPRAQQRHGAVALRVGRALPQARLQPQVQAAGEHMANSLQE